MLCAHCRRSSCSRKGCRKQVAMKSDRIYDSVLFLSFVSSRPAARKSGLRWSAERVECALTLSSAAVLFSLFVSVMHHVWKVLSINQVFLVQLVKCKVIPRWFHLQNKMPLIFHRIMKSQKQMSVFSWINAFIQIDWPLFRCSWGNNPCLKPPRQEKAYDANLVIFSSCQRNDHCTGPSW